MSASRHAEAAAVSGRSPRPFGRITLSRQFQLVSATLLAIGMTALGTWLGHQIENNALKRATAISSAYVESILAVQLRNWQGSRPLDADIRAALDQIFVAGPLHRKVVYFRLWDADGHVRYSSDLQQAERRLPINGMLAEAFRGAAQSHIHDGSAEQANDLPEPSRYKRLVEVYVPLRLGNTGEVAAVAEFYHSSESLDREIDAAQKRSWALLAAITLLIYLLLFGSVRRANNTILHQQRALRHKLTQLRRALADNERMGAQLRDAGARTTALNEQFLHRIAADLHDGPAQGIAFALLRFDELSAAGATLAQREEADRIRHALRAALAELRTIAADLPLPGIADLTLAETARRAVADGEHLSGRTVTADIDAMPGDAPLEVKIALYRVIQESLANSWRHAPDGAPRLRVGCTDGRVRIDVRDAGDGFDVSAVPAGHMGLALMRERVRLLGGDFEVDSAKGRGTRIRASIPLSSKDERHG